MADDGQQDGAREDRGKDRKADGDLMGQENPESRGSGGHIEEAKAHLQKNGFAAWEANPHIPPADLPTALAVPQQPESEGGQKDDANALVEPGRDPVERGERLRLKRGAEAHNGSHADPECKPRDGCQLCHLGKRQTGRAIDTPAHGARRYQGKA
jgi:hypothetical protein